MANGDKNKKAEERTKRIAISQGERTARKKIKLTSKTDRIRSRHPQNEKMQSAVDHATGPRSLFDIGDIEKEDKGWVDKGKLLKDPRHLGINDNYHK